MKNGINVKALIGIFAYAISAQANNLTSGILAYMMMTYSEVSQTTVSMVMTVPAIVGTVFAFISGNIMNKVGSKKMLLFIHGSLFISGMIFLFFGNKTSVYVLWLAAAFYGFLLGGSTVVLGQLFVDNISDIEKRGTFYGYACSVMSLGGVFFASIGGAIAAANGGAHWERAYYLYFLILVCLIIEFICIPDKKPQPEIPASSKEKKDKSADKLPLKVWLIAINYGFFFLFLYAFSLNLSEYVITTHSLGTSVEAGLGISFLTVGGIISGVCFGWYSKLLRKWTVPFMMALVAVGYAITVFIPNIIMLYIAGGLLGFAMMGCSPYIISEFSRITTPKSYPKAMSIFSGLMNVGMMVAVYVLAFLAGLFAGDSTSVDGKLFIAFVGVILVFVTAIPIYTGKGVRKS